MRAFAHFPLTLFLFLLGVTFKLIYNDHLGGEGEGKVESPTSADEEGHHRLLLRLLTEGAGEIAGELTGGAAAEGEGYEMKEGSSFVKDDNRLLLGNFKNFIPVFPSPKSNLT